MADKRTARDPDGRARRSPAPFRAATKPRSAISRERELHVCPTCSSALVYPVDWAPVERRDWSVDLRCPECEWHGSGVYAQEVVDRFDEALDRGTDQLLGDLRLLTRANMEDQVERFVTALRAGWILPEDF